MQEELLFIIIFSAVTLLCNKYKNPENALTANEDTWQNESQKVYAGRYEKNLCGMLTKICSML